MHHTGAQQQILEMIRARRAVQAREFIRECQGWDFRKAICRLVKKGYPIYNIMPPGQEATYVWQNLSTTKGLTK